MLGSHAFINTILSQSTPVLNFQYFELLATNGAFALSGSRLSKHQVKILPASVTGRTSVLHFLYVYIQGKIISLHFMCIFPFKSKLKFFFLKKIHKNKLKPNIVSQRHLYFPCLKTSVLVTNPSPPL